MKEIRIKESLVKQPANIRHDPDKGIVFGVKLVSFGESYHKRIYDKTCGADINKYHGVKVNIDHQDNPENAPFPARFGRIFNPKIGTDGLYGDLKYNPKHQLAEQFKWWVDNDPTAVGLSINALAKSNRMQNGKLVVTGFAKIDSVDLVGDPASTHGIFESKGEQEPASPIDENDDEESPDDSFDEGPTLFDEALAKLAEAAVLEAGKLDVADCARKVRAIADLLDDMEGGEESEEDDTEGDGETQKSEEEQMKESKVENQNDEKVSNLEKLVATLQSELTEIRTRESKAAEYGKRKLAMKQKCVDAKLDAKIVSDIFVETLASQDSDEVVQRLIEDRREFATPKVESETPISSGKGIKTIDAEALKKTLLGV